ncbi:hypothetical protein Pcinc_031831 [Petrolisthes cinctipes]|uniref:Uncharacterized protein n=1 Tax=Petrolisthes cinctipes TaxID=88211 RepID=A0AAE1EVL3_PETCI|nr:hypothetical protein Pcinc_031831 [Petrolisthes cinctipes]
MPSQNDGSPALPCPALIPTSAVLEPQDHRRSSRCPQYQEGGMKRHKGHIPTMVERASSDAAATYPERSPHGLQCPAGQHACGTTSVSYSASHKQAAEDGWQEEKEKRKQPFAWGRENAGRLGRIIYIFTGMGNGDESCWMDGFV